MRKAFPIAAIAIAQLISNPAFAESEIELLKRQLDSLKNDYEHRIEALEARLEKTEVTAQRVMTETRKIAAKPTRNNTVAANRFNPAVTLILDGRYANFKNDPEAYELPGFSLGGESGLGSKGLSLGESELAFSANIDNKFYGQATIGFHNDEGATEVDLEEAFIQTLALDGGFTLKAGRFFSAMGYMNEQHAHSWDFADAPLIYRGLFGDQLRDDGLQLTYVAPTDLFLQFGAELSSGSYFPGGGESNDIGAGTLFANIGGDILSFKRRIIKAVSMHMKNNVFVFFSLISYPYPMLWVPRD